MKKVLLFFIPIITVIAFIIGIYFFSDKNGSEPSDDTPEPHGDLQTLIDKHTDVTVYQNLGFQAIPYSDYNNYIPDELFISEEKKTFDATIFKSSKDNGTTDKVYWFSYNSKNDKESHLSGMYIAVETQDKLHLIDYMSNYCLHNEVTVCDITGDGIDDILIVQNELNTRGYRCIVIRSTGSSLELLLDTNDGTQEYPPFLYNGGKVDDFGFVTRAVNDFKIEITNTFTNTTHYVDMRNKFGCELTHDEEGFYTLEGYFYIADDIIECIPVDVNKDGVFELLCRSYLGSRSYVDVCYISYLLSYNSDANQFEVHETEIEEISCDPDLYEKVSLGSLSDDGGALDRIEYKADGSFKKYEFTLTGLSDTTIIKTEERLIRTITAYGHTLEFTDEDNVSIYGPSGIDVFSTDNAVIVSNVPYHVGDTYIFTEHGIEKITPEEATCVALQVNDSGELRYTRFANKFNVTHSGALDFATAYDEFYYEEGSADIVEGKLVLSEADSTYTISDKFDLNKEFEMYKQMWENSDCHSVEDVFEFNKNRGY